MCRIYLYLSKKNKSVQIGTILNDETKHNIWKQAIVRFRDLPEAERLSEERKTEMVDMVTSTVQGEGFGFYLYDKNKRSTSLSDQSNTSSNTFIVKLDKTTSNILSKVV